MSGCRKPSPRRRECQFVHGDFRLATLIFAHHSFFCEVLGVIDWELYTLGDPWPLCATVIDDLDDAATGSSGLAVLDSRRRHSRQRNYRAYARPGLRGTSGAQNGTSRSISSLRAIIKKASQAQADGTVSSDDAERLAHRPCGWPHAAWDLCPQKQKKQRVRSWTGMPV